MHLHFEKLLGVEFVTQTMAAHVRLEHASNHYLSVCLFSGCHAFLITVHFLACRFLLPDPIPWWQVPFLQAASVFLKSPEQGAQTSIYLATSPEVEGISSKYYSDCKPKTSSKVSYDADVARRLWEVSQEMTDAPTGSWQRSSRAQSPAGAAIR